VRRALQAYEDGDVEAMLSYIDPEGEIQSAIIGGVEGRTYQGHDGIRRWFAERVEGFEYLSMDLTEFRDLGDRVVGFGHVHARGRESGLELDSATGWVFDLRAGKMVKAQGFLSREAALEAAGLDE
jgi:ketosteroid isomerase-like protein